MTTGERRAVVRQVEARYEVRKLYVCRALGFERSVIRFVPQRPLWDAPLRERLRTLAAEHARWGCPRLHRRLLRDGVFVNYKRVERLHRLEGLAVRRRARKRLAVPRIPRPAVHAPNDLWSIDFVSDQLASGRRFRSFTVMDCCTRECLAIGVAHSLPAEAVIAVLTAVIAERGAARGLSLDNGSEFRCRVFDAWAADRGIALQFIQRGKPIQNPHIESFNRKFRDECLNQHWFLSFVDARFHIEQYRRRFNTERPHEACFPLTPSVYARTFTTPTPAQLSAQNWRTDGGTLIPRTIASPRPAPLGTPSRPASGDSARTAARREYGSNARSSSSVGSVSPGPRCATAAPRSARRQPARAHPLRFVGPSAW